MIAPFDGYLVCENKECEKLGEKFFIRNEIPLSSDEAKCPKCGQDRNLSGTVHRGPNAGPTKKY